MYQLPQRSFATKGKLYAEATDVTKVLSEMIEEKRLWIERVERRSDESVPERFGVFERCGKRMSASDKGLDILIPKLSRYCQVWKLAIGLVWAIKRITFACPASC
jgi:hypothetical protein